MKPLRQTVKYNKTFILAVEDGTITKKWVAFTPTACPGVVVTRPPAAFNKHQVYTLTHKPSGYAICFCRDPRDAQTIAQRLSELLVNWEADKTTYDHAGAIHRCMDALGMTFGQWISGIAQYDEVGIK